MPEHIQIGDVSPRVQYTANGTQTVFAFPFPIFDETDLKVFLDEAEQSAGFSVSGAGQNSGGDVTFNAAPGSDVLVTLFRDIPITRTTDFQEGGAFRADSINDELDRQTAMIQQVANESSRALTAATTDPTLSLTLPTKAARAGKFLKFDSDGNPTSASDVPIVHSGSGAPSSTLGNPGDLYIDTAGGTLYGPKSGANWGGAALTMTGPAGPTGEDGADGANGADGDFTYAGSQQRDISLSDNLPFWDASNSNDPSRETLADLADAIASGAGVTTVDAFNDDVLISDASDANRLKRAKLPSSNGVVSAAKIAFHDTDGDDRPGSGVVGSDGQLYIPVAYNPFTGYFFNGKTATMVGSAPAGGRYGYMSSGINIGHYGKVADTWLGYRTLFVLTEGGFLLGAGYNDVGILDAAYTYFKCLAGPSADEFGDTPAVNKTITAMQVSARTVNGSLPNSPTYCMIVALASDGTAYTWGYGNYGNGAGGTSNGFGTQILTAAATPLTNITAVYVGGARYPACHLVTSGGTIYAFGYGVQSQLGISGDTANKSYATATSFPSHAGKSGVANIRYGGQESDLATFLLYGDGDLYACGENGSGWHADGANTDNSMPVLVSGDVADFWPSNQSNPATYGALFLRLVTGNGMRFAGHSGNENLPVLTTSTVYNTLQTLSSGIWATRYATQMWLQSYYHGGTLEGFARLDDGHVYALGGATRDYYGWAQAGAFTVGVWEKVPIPLFDGDSIPDDYDTLRCNRYSYANLSLITTNGVYYEGPSGSQTSGLHGVNATAARLGNWVPTFGLGGPM